jgi:hypothetical protein
MEGREMVIRRRDDGTATMVDGTDLAQFCACA